MFILAGILVQNDGISFPGRSIETAATTRCKREEGAFCISIMMLLFKLCFKTAFNLPVACYEYVSHCVGYFMSPSHVVLECVYVSTFSFL